MAKVSPHIVLSVRILIGYRTMTTPLACPKPSVMKSSARGGVIHRVPSIRYMNVCSPSFSGTSTDHSPEESMILIGVAFFPQPLKDPTRLTCLAPGASIVNRTLPANDLGNSGFTTLGLAHPTVPTTT